MNNRARFFLSVMVFMGTNKITAQSDFVKMRVSELTIKAETELSKLEADKALITADEILELSNKVEYSHGLAIGHLTLGTALWRQGVLDSAFQHVTIASGHFLSLSDSAGFIKCVSRKGAIEDDRTRNDEALRYFYQALRYHERHGNITDAGNSLNGIGIILSRSGRDKEAEDTYLNALDILRKQPKKVLVANVLSNLGDLYVPQGRHEEALVNFKEALRIDEELDLKWGIAFQLSNIGDVLLIKGDTLESLSYQRRALSLRRELGYKIALSSNLISVGRTLCQMSKPYDALPYLKEAVEVAEQIDTWNVLFRAYDNLSKCFAQLGDFGAAYNYRMKAVVVNDSLYNKQNAENVAELSALFDTERKEKEIARLDAEAEVQNLLLDQKNFQLTAGSILALLFLLLGVFMWYQYRIIRKVNNEIVKKNEIITGALSEKELLLREIHHRVKNNLQIISSLLSLQSREINDTAALRAVNESRNRVKSMALIHQNLYKEDDLTGIDMRDYVTKLSNSLVRNYKFQSGDIEVNTDVDELNLDVDTTIPLGLILNELITNVLKYAFPDGRSGKMDIRLKDIDNTLVLEVADNGVGVDHNSSLQEESSGFGMKMIKTFSKKLNAEHEVLSQNGTLVRLRIRKYKLAS